MSSKTAQRKEVIFMNGYRITYTTIDGTRYIENFYVQCSERLLRKLFNSTSSHTFDTIVKIETLDNEKGE